MELSAVPKFDITSGTAGKGVLRWIIIPTQQYAKLRVSTRPTGPGYKPADWVDALSLRRTIVCAVGARGEKGRRGHRGLSASIGRDRYFTPFELQAVQKTTSFASVVRLPAPVVRTRPFKLFMKAQFTRFEKKDYRQIRSAVMLEIDPTIDLELYGMSRTTTPVGWPSPGQISALRAKAIREWKLSTRSSVADISSQRVVVPMEMNSENNRLVFVWFNETAMDPGALNVDGIINGYYLSFMQ